MARADVLAAASGARRTRAWRSHAFGLEIEGGFEAPGLPPATGAPYGPRTRVEIVGAASIDDGWPAAAATRLVEEHFDDSPEPARSIDHAPGAGYRLYARHFGLAHVSEDGAHVRCAPPEDEPWSWQRFLVGRILPLAAVLRGREVFHAAGVVVDGRAIALLAETGVGKTSTTAHLVLEGAGFLTDDVLAIDRHEGGFRAHPGASILCVRPTEREAMGPERWSRLGRLLGDSVKLYVEVAREQEPSPLAAMYFLVPRSQGAVIERIERPDFQRLVGATFISSVRTPQRLRAQFELCAELAPAVPMFRVGAARDVGAAAVARLILDHASA
jgi:hypothetical protein